MDEGRFLKTHKIKKGEFSVYFQRKNNYFYSIFANLNNQLRYCLLVLFLSCLFITWFFTLYTRLEDKEVRLKADIAGLKQKEKLLFKITDEIQKLSFQIKELDTAVSDIVIQNHSRNPIDLVIRNAQLCGLHIIDCKLEDKVIKNFYEKTIISFSLIGDFDQVIEFFIKFCSFANWIKCKKITLSLIDEEHIKIDCIYKIYTPSKEIKCQKEEIFIPI